MSISVLSDAFVTESRPPSIRSFVSLSPPRRSGRIDAVGRLRASFPDIWSDLLESADPDTPYLLYFAFGCLLLDHRGDNALWSRAYRFFDDVAEGGSAEVKNILTEAFDRLWDSCIRAEVDKGPGPVAQHLFRRSSLK